MEFNHHVAYLARSTIASFWFTLQTGTEIAAVEGLKSLITFLWQLISMLMIVMNLYYFKDGNENKFQDKSQIVITQTRYFVKRFLKGRLFDLLTT